MKARTQPLGDNNLRIHVIADSICMMCLVALILSILGISVAIMFSFAA